MRFEIPQFINIEDKLIGPFSLRQAIYLIGGGAIIYIIYKLLPSIFLFIFAIPIALFSLALVFYKPHGREFIEVVNAFVIYALSNKFYLWRRDDRLPAKQDVKRKKARFLDPGEIPEDERKNKIADLAWSLDILDFDLKDRDWD